MTAILRVLTLGSVLLALSPGNAHATIWLFHKTPKKTSAELRAEYLANVSQSVVDSSSRRTSGSLWSPDGLMVEPAADYKAHSLNDIVTVVVSVQTTAAPLLPLIVTTMSWVEVAFCESVTVTA